MKFRSQILAVLAITAALAGCASSISSVLAERQSWALEVAAPRGACIYRYAYEWPGAPMLEMDQAVVKRGCAALSGIISMDVPLPRSIFVASWTDEAGTVHRVNLDLYTNLAGRDLSHLRIELSPSGAHVFIKEFDRTRVSVNGLYGDKPEVPLFVKNN